MPEHPPRGIRHRTAIAGVRLRTPARSSRLASRPHGRLPLLAALVVVARPRLWPGILRLVPPGWGRRWPPVPLPPADYLRFRAQTMYGDQGGPLTPADLVVYLEWCRRMGSGPR